jgi:hypothetical protein
VKRLIIFDHTGPYADNLRHARRLARKIQGAQAQGECILVDAENVDATEDFLRILLRNAVPEKVKICGLPISTQVRLYEKRAERERE